MKTRNRRARVYLTKGICCADGKIRRGKIRAAEASLGGKDGPSGADEKAWKKIMEAKQLVAGTYGIGTETEGNAKIACIS